jgi:hypothetical protein
MFRRATIIAPLLLLLIVTTVFWKLITTQYTWMDHPDMAYQLLPWYQFQAESWQHGHFPTWDPKVWGGQPLVGQLQPGAAYPPNWLLFLLPLKDGHINRLWMNIYFILTHFLAALFCFWLCRDLARSVPGSLLGAVAFALTGVVGSIGWPQMLNGAIWIPLVFLFFLRFIRGYRRLSSAALAGTFLGVSFLCGHHQIPMFIALTMLALWLVEVWRKRVTALPYFGIFLLFAALMSGLQIFPAYEYGQYAVRWVGSQNPVSWTQYVPYLVHTQFSLHPAQLSNLILPSVNADNVFVGAAICLFATIGLIACFDHREVRILAAVSAVAILFSFGGISLFHGLLYLLVPMVEKVRTPALAIVICQFATAVSAAFGLDALLSKRVSQRWTWGLVIAGLLTWIYLAFVPVFANPSSGAYDHLAVLGLICFALAGTIWAYRRQNLSHSKATALIFLIVLFEIGTVTGQNFRSKEQPAGFLDALTKDDDLIRFLRGQRDFTRLEVDTDAVPYNIGDWAGIDQFRSYLGGMTSNLVPFEIDRLRGGHLAPALFALDYFVGRKPIRNTQQPIFQSKSGLTVFRNPEAFPLTWSVHEANTVDRSQLVPRLQAADLRKTGFLLGPAPLLQSCSGSDEIQVVSRTSDYQVLDVRMACKGIVILSETNYPGWQATVDGHRSTVYESYGVLRSVVVDAGSHRVEFRYHPSSVYWGAALSSVGFIGSLAAAWCGRKWNF